MVRALATVFVLMLTAIATAQPPPNPEGAKLFEEGRALAGAGKWQEACDKFARSLELDPAIGTQLNYADCHEKLDHNAQAWRLFDNAADAEKITNPERAKFSRGRADALLSKLGVVILKIGTPDAPMIAVSISGRTIKPAAVIKEIVDPGEVAIAVTAANAPPFQRTEAILAGKTVIIEVPAFGDAGTGDGGGGNPAVSDSVGPRQRSRVLLAYGLGGAGAVALLAGVIVGVKAKGDYNAQFDGPVPNCTDTSPPQCNAEGFSAQSDAVTLANVGTALAIGGIVLIGAGAVLFLTAPREVVVAPTATASSAGISVVGRF